MTTTYTLVKGAKAETRELGSDNVISQRDSKDLAANTIVRNASKRRSVAPGAQWHRAGNKFAEEESN